MLSPVAPTASLNSDSGSQVNSADQNSLHRATHDGADIYLAISRTSTAVGQEEIETTGEWPA